MSGRSIFLCHPSALLNPLIEEWVEEVREVMRDDNGWVGWSLRCWPCNANCAVSVRDLSSAIIGDLGPCAFVRPVQERVFVQLREILATRSPVLIGDASDSSDLLHLLEEVRNAHLSGEPMLPRKLVVALLLIAKLDKNHRWGGHNRKGFMWMDDLKNGRGFDEEFADQLPQVLNDLLQAQILEKKKSQTSSKYALNRQRQKEIFAALQTRRFPDDVDRILRRDPRLASARTLDSLAMEGCDP